MKFIELTRGKRTIVDEEDYETLMQWKWFYHPLGYAARGQVIDGKYQLFYMHRVIMNPGRNLDVDHISGNRLDNCWSNLRTCSRTENIRNQTKKSKNPYKGICWHKQDGMWQAGITVKGKYIFIGLFSNPRYAALAYDLWAIDLFGDFAKTNFTRAA